MDFGVSMNPLASIQAQFNADRNYDLQRQQMNQQTQYNQRSEQLDNKKYHFAREQYLEGMRRDDNKLQRFVQDANKAGVSISTALGAAPSTPVQVSIPGHGTRRAGTAAQKQNVDMGSVNMQIGTKRNETALQTDIHNLHRTRADADYAFYRMLKEKQDWERSRGPAVPETPPNRYELYTDNTKEAIKHQQSGGYVMPTGAQWELPQSMGGYEFSRPYWKPGDEKPSYDAEQHYYNNGLGIAP